MVDKRVSSSLKGYNINGVNVDQSSEFMTAPNKSSKVTLTMKNSCKENFSYLHILEKEVTPRHF